MRRRPSGLTRRGMLATGGAALAVMAVKPFAWAAGRSGLHGLSIFGELKYPADFKHFDYVNEAAPKGGRMNFSPPNWGFNQSTQTFNTLNSFVLKGDAPPRMEMTFDTLMARATDEPDAVYGLVAESVDVSDDRNSFTFHLRPEARFHDGSPLTAEDVAFSLMLLKEKGHPSITEPIAPMVKAEATDPATVVVMLSGKQNRFTILTIVGLPVFSKTYYSDHPFDSSSLDAPLASGAYKVGRMSAGRFIEYDRVADYWGKDLPVNVGQSNFDRLRIDFFQERQTEFEAFKKGEITFREEATSSIWATGYDFPAVSDGKVKKNESFSAEARPAMYGMFFNTRRAKFADAPTRQALALAFDFEWTNHNIFYDAYIRLSSYFEHSDFKANGPPSEAEAALLEPFRADLPSEVFDAAYVPPKTDGSGRDRAVLKQAQDLLTAAGWKQTGSDLNAFQRFLQMVESLFGGQSQTDSRFVARDGKPLTVEFLVDAQVFEKVLAPYRENLSAIGVDATIRQVDPAQYQARLNDFDFDVVLAAFSMSATPIDGPPQFFGSKAAGTSGSFNLAGIREPAVDAALDKLRAVATRDELIVITRAIDRVLRARHFWVPGWYLADHRVAMWDVFAWPPNKPAYDFSPEATWWFDAAKAAAVGYSG